MLALFAGTETNPTQKQSQILVNGKVLEGSSFEFKMNTALQVWDGELSIITTPPPRVSTSTDIVVKVAYSGVCGTDLHILSKEFPCAKSVILGHEFSGVVTEIGSDVKHCSVGERSVRKGAEHNLH